MLSRLRQIGESFTQTAIGLSHLLRLIEPKGISQTMLRTTIITHFLRGNLVENHEVLHVFCHDVSMVGKETNQRSIIKGGGDCAPIAEY